MNDSEVCFLDGWYWSLLRPNHGYVWNFHSKFRWWRPPVSYVWTNIAKRKLRLSRQIVKITGFNIWICIYIYDCMWMCIYIYIYTYTYMSKYVSIYMDAPHLHQCSHRSIKSVAGCSYAKHDHARRRPSWEQSADFLQFMEDWTWHTLQSMAIHNNNNTIVSTITMIVLLSNTLVQSRVVHN